MSLTPFKQRLIGRRREIYKALQSGTYWEWLEHDRLYKIKLQRFQRFRAKFSALRGTLLPPKNYQEYLSSDCQAADPEDIQATMHWRGERRMWASVMVRAVLDFKMFGEISREESPLKSTLGSQARGWLYDSSEEIGSFRWICSILDLGSPDAALRRMETTEYVPRQCASQKKKQEPQ
jgi:hypothetical protein